MHARSLLTPSQRGLAVTLFEQGHGYRSVAAQLHVSSSGIEKLYDRWRIYGRFCLVEKRTKRQYPFEVKKEVVTRFLEGETRSALAREFQLSSPVLISSWVRHYRVEGVDGLRAKPKGRPKGSTVPPAMTQEEKLRRQVARLEAENAYLKKLRDLRDQGLR